MDDLIVNIRASSVPAWADCAARANFEIQRSGPLPNRPHVGSVVGTLVHQKLLEGPNAQWKLPDYIEWDAHTRNMRELFLQVDLMSDRAFRELGDRGWQMCKSEIEMEAEYYVPGIRLRVTGHMDGTIESPSHPVWRLASFELKTGINPPRGAWLQTGVYGWLWERHDPGHTGHIQPLELATVLWLDRRDGSVRWEERSPKMLTAVAEAQLGAIARHMLHEATYNPSSLSCSSCLNSTCPVRFGEPNIHLPTPEPVW